MRQNSVGSAYDVGSTDRDNISSSSGVRPKASPDSNSRQPIALSHLCVLQLRKSKFTSAMEDKLWESCLFRVPEELLRPKFEKRTPRGQHDSMTCVVCFALTRRFDHHQRARCGSLGAFSFCSSCILESISTLSPAFY